MTDPAAEEGRATGITHAGQAAAPDPQPVDPPWNTGGYANNAVHRAPVTVHP